MESLFGFVLFILGIIAIAVAVFLLLHRALITSEGNRLEGPTASKKVSTVVLAFGIVLIALSFSIVIVPPGNVGVVTFLGSVQNTTLEPGIHLQIPILNGVKTFETRVQAHQFQDLEAASKENLSLKITGTMNYHIDGTYASILYSTLSDDFAAKVIDPAFADYIKQVIPSYSADSTSPNWVLAHRDEIRAATKDALNQNLARYHIVVDDIYIANIGNPDDYEAAIRARQVAQQQVATEQQVTQQKIQQANQAVEVAKGQANAAIESARGQAAAQVELAEAQAKANDLIGKSLTPEVIQFQMIQKLSDKIQVMLLPAGQQFLLDPKTVLSGGK